MLCASAGSYEIVAGGHVEGRFHQACNIMIYVDDACLPYGRMVMCHLFADTTTELLEFIDRLRINRKHIQKSGTPREHFDICLTKRKLAVKLGAKEVKSRDLVVLIRRKEDAQARVSDGISA